ITATGLLIFLVISAGITPGSAAAWRSNQKVSDGIDGPSYFPSMALDSEGNLYIAWCAYSESLSSGEDFDIFFRMLNMSTGTWGDIELVSIDSTDESLNPSIAVDSAGNIHVAWQDLTNLGSDGPDVDIFYRLWNASSMSWNDTIVMSNDSTSDSLSPCIAVDNSTNDTFIAWEDYTNYNSAGTDSDIFLRAWDYSDQAFNTTEVISTDSLNDSREVSIAVNNNTGDVHLAWSDLTNASSSDIFHKLRYSNESLGATEVVSENYTGYSSSPSIAVDGSGTIHVVWDDFSDNSNSGPDADIYYRKWNSTASNWTSITLISDEPSNNIRDSLDPDIALDKNGLPHVVWVDYSDVSGDDRVYKYDADIFYTKWNNSTLSWAEVSVASEDDDDRNSLNPSLVIDENLTARVVWSDGPWDIYYNYYDLNFTPEDEEEEDDTIWYIVGGVAGGGGFFVILLLVWANKKKKKKREKADLEASTTEPEPASDKEEEIKDENQ
ncbi:MAG: hypothetical protein ACFFCS_03855, partial [Candidatus Hodarchaeota archaeon]